MVYITGYYSGLSDGMVDLFSCKNVVNYKVWGKDPSFDFYESKLNHDDGRFIHGDNPNDRELQPLTWLRNVMIRFKYN